MQFLFQMNRDYHLPRSKSIEFTQFSGWPLHKLRKSLFFLFLLGLGLLLVACSSGQPLPSPTATAESLAAAEPSPIPSPTDTPIPQPAAPTVILYAPPGSDPQVGEGLQTLLAGLSADAGLQFEVVSQLSTQDLDEQVELVVILAPDPGIESLAASAPETQFLVIGMPGIQPDANVSTINPSAGTPDQLAFAAGYLAAAITEDWRTGVVSEQETPAGLAAATGFTNGVYFLCGLCRPVLPPFPIPGYPLTVQLPVSASQEERGSLLSYLQEWQVGTVYVAPEVAEPVLLEELAGAGISIIGTGSPSPELRSSWAATIGFSDPAEAVEQVWAALLEGQGGQSISLSLVLQDVNPQLVSPGRQRLVEEMLAELQAGYIDTGVDPATGESRFSD